MSAVASTTSLWPHKLYYILVFTTSVCVLYVSTVKSYALSISDRAIVRSFYVTSMRMRKYSSIEADGLMSEQLLYYGGRPM